MTWVVNKNPAGFRLLCDNGRVMATFKRQATDAECEVIRKALETADALVKANNKIMQREARLQETIIELADAVKIITRLEAEAKPEGKTNA